MISFESKSSEFQIVSPGPSKPSWKYFAITKESNVLVYRAPGPASRDYGPFALERVLKGAFEDTTCLAWSTCSQIIAVGSRDTTTRIYALPKFKNLRVYCLGGHTEPVINVFFQKGSLKCYTLSLSLIHI